MTLEQIKTARLAFQGDDAAFIAWATTPVVTVTRPSVERSVFLRYLYEQGLYARLVGAQANPNAQVAGAAVTGVGYLNNPDFDLVVWADPMFQALLGAMVAGGVYTQAEVDAAHAAMCSETAAPIPDLTADLLAQAMAVNLPTERDAAREAVLAAWYAKYNAGITAINQAAAGNGTIPATAAEVWALVQG